MFGANRRHLGPERHSIRRPAPPLHVTWDLRFAFRLALRDPSWHCAARRLSLSKSDLANSHPGFQARVILVVSCSSRIRRGGGRHVAVPTLVCPGK